MHLLCCVQCWQTLFLCPCRQKGYYFGVLFNNYVGHYVVRVVISKNVHILLSDPDRIIFT